MLRLRPLMPLTLFALAVLAGCGGGGGDSGSTTDTTGGSTTTTATTHIVVTDASTGYDCGLGNFQAELLQRINALRAAGANCGTSGSFPATTALTWHAKLAAAAAGHSADMAAKNYFEHDSADGTTMSARVTAAGYAWTRVAENIAAGYPTVDSVMTGWTNSAGHCANLMNPNLREVGVACVPGTSSSTYPNYWTMDLGAPQ